MGSLFQFIALSLKGALSLFLCLVFFLGATLQGFAQHNLPPSPRESCLTYLEKVPLGYEVLDSEFALGRKIEIDNSRGPGLRDPEKGTIRLQTYNLYNFYNEKIVPVEDEEGNHVGLKATSWGKFIKPKMGLSETIREVNPDIIAVQEIGDGRLLDTFQKDYLGDKYFAFLLRGNSDRNIEVGALIKKDMRFKAEYHSFRKHRAYYQGKRVKIFSRDLPALVLKNDKDEAFLIIMITHFKSQMDAPNDPNGNKLRLAQAKAVKSIENKLKKRYGENVPLVLTGDFNNHVPKAPEFEPLFQKGRFHESLNLAHPDGISDKERYTYYYFGNEKPDKRQFDAILVSDFMAKQGMVVNSKVQEYQDESGEIIPRPTSWDDVKKQPSDHFSIWADIDMRLARD